MRSIHTLGIVGILVIPFSVSAFTFARLDADTIRATWENPEKQVRILIVPGHEPTYGGAEYRHLLERDMVVDLTNELLPHFQSDKRYELLVTRDKREWNPLLAGFFQTEWQNIISFIEHHKSAMARLVEHGYMISVENGVPHNNAPENVAVRLYGITRWANEQHIDIMLHLHFNDTASRRARTPGEYSGLSLYIPEQQYGNSAPSAALAQSIYNRLSRFIPTSDMPFEQAGIIESQDLIALGSFNTARSASVLIEYGYIYEQQFQDATIRALAMKELAYQTHQGVQDFFTKDFTARASSALFPYRFERTIARKTAPDTDIFRLQTALTLEGLYPPSGRARRDCPITGVFGVCTQTALRAFQARYGITGDGSILGPQTRAQLNTLYGK